MSRFATQIRSALLALPHWADLCNLPLSPRQLDGCRKLLDLLDEAERPEGTRETERCYGAFSLIGVQCGEASTDLGSFRIGSRTTAVLECRPDIDFRLSSLSVVILDDTGDHDLQIKSVSVGSRVLTTGALSLSTFPREDGINRISFCRNKTEIPGTPIHVEIANLTSYAINFACKASLDVPADKDGPPLRPTFDEEDPSFDLSSFLPLAQGALSAWMFHRASKDPKMQEVLKRAREQFRKEREEGKQSEECGS